MPAHLIILGTHEGCPYIDKDLNPKVIITMIRLWIICAVIEGTKDPVCS